MDKNHIKWIVVLLILAIIIILYYNFIIVKRMKFQYESVKEDNYLDMWREQGKKVVLRFVCDVPGELEHLDIPDWLYEITGDGTNYDMDYGKGYSPNYSNNIFIDAHEKAIKALGENFGQDSFVCYVQLGSLGHWGEWHVKYDEGIIPIPKSEISVEYVKPYIEAFPNAKILMRRPFEMVKAYGLGVYNDMTGHEDSTLVWLDWINNGGSYDEAEEPLILNAVSDIWKTSPVGGEFTSSISMKEMLTTEIERTLWLLKETHMTFIGPKTLKANDEMIEYQEETAQILKNLGYRYGVTSCKVKYNSWTNKMYMDLIFENRGTAPMYFDWPVYIYILDEKKNTISKIPLDVDLRTISQNESHNISISFPWEMNKKETLAIGIGIENPETKKAEVYLDMNVLHENGVYLLYYFGLSKQ